MPIDWDEVRRQRAQQSPREAIAPPAIDWNEVRQARKLTQPGHVRSFLGGAPRGVGTLVTETVKGIGRLGEMGYIGQMGAIQPLYTAIINKLFGMPTPEQFGGRQIVKAGGFATKQVERALPLREYKNPWARFGLTTIPVGAGRLVGIAALGWLGAPAWVAGLGGAALGGFSQASEEYDKALKATGDPSKATMSYLVNLPIGAIDAIPVMSMFNRMNKLSGGAGNKIVAKWATGKVGRLVAEAGKKAPRLTGGTLGALEEGFQEFVQGTMTNMSARQIYDESRQLLESTGEGTAAGVFLGFFANAIGIHVRMRSNQPDVSVEEQQLYEDASENIEQAKGNIAEQMADRARPEGISDEQWATLRPKFVDELAERIETGRWLEPETTTENANDVAAGLVMQQVMEGTLKSENLDVQQAFDDIRTGTRRGVPSEVTLAADEVASHLRNQHINEIKLGVYKPVGESREVIAAGKRVVKHVESTNKQTKLQEQLATLETEPEAPETTIVEPEVRKTTVTAYRGDVEGTNILEPRVATPPDLRGIYFATDKEHAAVFAKMGQESGEVGEYVVTLNNPATEAQENEILTSLGATVDDDGFMVYTDNTATLVADELQSRGHDGVIREQSGEIIVFDTKSIASPSETPAVEQEVVDEFAEIPDELAKSGVSRVTSQTPTSLGAKIDGETISGIHISSNPNISIDDIDVSAEMAVSDMGAGLYFTNDPQRWRGYVMQQSGQTDVYEIPVVVRGNFADVTKVGPSKQIAQKLKEAGFDGMIVREDFPPQTIVWNKDAIIQFGDWINPEEVAPAVAEAAEVTPEMPVVKPNEITGKVAGEAEKVIDVPDDLHQATTKVFDALSDAPDDILRPYISDRPEIIEALDAIGIKVKHFTKENLDKLPDDVRKMVSTSNAVTWDNKYLAVVEGKKASPETLQHEVMHLVYTNISPGLKSGGISRVLKDGETIVRFIYSESIPNTLKEDVESLRRILDAYDGVLGESNTSIVLMRQAQDIGLVSFSRKYGRIAKHLGLPTSTRQQRQYATIAVYLYKAQQKDVDMEAAGLADEAIAYLSGVDDTFAKRVLKSIEITKPTPAIPEPDEIPVSEEAKGEIAQIHKQLSVISQSILSKQRLRSNTKKLITDIDKKVKQELEAQGLTPTEVKPPGERTQQAVARELKQAQEDVLAALGRNKDGTIKADERLFEGKQIFLKGNWFTVVDKVARQRYIREGNTAKEADEAATRRWEVPPEEMGIIHKLLTGYNRVDKKTRRKMDNAVGFAFDNKYDLEQIKIMAQMGFPSKPVDPDRLNEILSEAFGYKPGDTTDTIRTKMENLIADKTKEGRRKRRQFGDFLDKLITSGMDQQLRKMGPEGTQLADGITNLMFDVRGMIGDWSTGWKRMLVKSQLSESQFDDWVSLHEGVDEQNKPFTIDSLKNETGKIKYSDDILNRMAMLSQEFKALTDDIHKAATDAKIDVEYLANYWPRIFKWQEMSDSPIESTRTGYIRGIAERHGVTETEAQNLYEKYYKNRREFYAPNLEEERVVDMGGYVRTPDAVSEFINNAAQKIAEIQVFGKKYEKVIGDDGLISRIPDEQDSATAQQIFDRQFRREVGKGDTHALKAFEWMQNLGTIRLVFSAIPNSTQTLMAGFRTTFFDFATQTAKLGFGGKTFGMRSGKKRTEMIARAEEIGAVMDKTNRDFWASEFLGVKKDNPILDWTGFTATEKYNAILASNMGMSYADRLLSKLSKVKSGKGRYQSKELYDLLYSPTDIEQYGRNVHEVLKEYAQTHKGKIKLDELMENKTKLHKEANLKALLDNGEITQEQFDKFSEITIGDVATKGRMRAGLRVLDDSQMIVTGRFKLPYYWNSPAGKWFTQFKSFSYRSSQLFYREFKRKGVWRFLQSFIPYIMLSYLPHFGIARLRELIYGGNFDGDTWDFIEPIIATGIGAIPMQFIMAATYGKFAESLVPPGADVLVAPVVKTIEAVSGRATPSVMIEEFLRSAGALPPPLRVPFAIAGPIAAGVARRMRREKPTAISIRRRPTR